MTLLAAAASGVLFWAANPAPDFGLLAFVALVPMFAVARTWRTGVAAGAVGGIVAYLLVLRWVVPVAWFVWPVLAVWCALFWAVAVGLAGALRARLGPWSWPLAVASIWTVAEWVRGAVPLGGFTWGDVGTTQSGIGFTRALAATAGTFGVGWCVVAVNAALVSIVSVRRRSGAQDRRPVTAAAVLCSSIVGMFALGALLQPDDGSTGSFRVAVVQANRFEDGDVWPEKMLAEHLALTRDVVAAGGREARDNRLDLVVWGESSIWDQPVTDAVRSSITDASGGVPVVANAYVRLGARRWANDTIVVRGNGREVGRYRKRHPVPWGEYVPFRSVLEPLVPQLARVPRDAERGTTTGAIDIDGTVVGLLTCFESLFPRDVRSTVNAGAEMLVVTTNNSTFARSDLSAQYLAGSRMRAVESYRSEVVTSVNGRSAVFAPDGAVLGRTRLWEATTSVVEVPLHDGRTVYTRVGDWPVWLSVVAVMALGVIEVRWRRPGAERPTAPTGVDESPRSDAS